jgi:glycerophosphoryl diester phosphodiesterase
MVFEKRTPLIFAHRGASAYAPENTLAAFELAIQQKADLIEFDTKLSADQRVVIIHDQSVDRTTDGSGRVAALSFAQLRELNASSRFSDQYPYEKIPILEEVFEVCGGRIRINIELTNYLTPFDRLAEEVRRSIEKYQLQDQVMVSSFHPLPLRRFHDLCPEIPIGFLAKRGMFGFLSRGWLGRWLVPYAALHPEKSDVNPDLIGSAQRYGYRVHTFTVNDPAEMASLISLGVDGIITDDPLLAGNIIKSNPTNENQS